jgi:hypothetical protein
MGDAQYIPALLKLASDANQLLAAQHVAAKRLLDYDGETYDRVPWRGVIDGRSPRSPAWAGQVSWRLPEG